MTRTWFSQPLETVATFWRVLRRDGVVIGLTTHDRDLWIDGICHRAAPGMLPSAIRRSAGFEPDSAEVEGALSHASIASQDLADGRFDQARVLIGIVDWESGETHVLYRGSIGAVTEQAGSFTAELRSRKAELSVDTIPRTAPGCRAEFCGPECTLSAARFTHDAIILDSDATGNTVTISATVAGDDLVGGSLRWLDGSQAGISARVLAAAGNRLTLDEPISADLAAGTRARLRQGCDHTIATCGSRFGNGVNFRGEPFLPGNDLISRYAVAPQ